MRAARAAEHARAVHDPPDPADDRDCPVSDTTELPSPTVRFRLKGRGERCNFQPSKPGVRAMALKKGVDVKPAQGKLGILLPGMGAVATTFIAGVMSIRRGLGKPIGSLTQMGHIRLGKRTEGNSPRIKDYVSLARLDDVVFGGWDIFPDNAYQAAVRAGVLESKDLEPIKAELEAIKPMTAVFEQAYVKKLNGPNVKKGTSKADLADQLMADIKSFKEKNGCDRLVAVWC